MRTVVREIDLFEGDVKPEALLREYRRLLEVDMHEVAAGSLAPVACPGCLGETAEQAFTRFGIAYHCCSACQSLYASPRPSEGSLADFYRETPSAAFWRESLLPATREMRVAKLFRPRAEWILDVIDEYRSDAASVVSVGFHSDLLVAELVAQEGGLTDVVVANPVADIEFAESGIPRVEVRPMKVSRLHELDAADVFLAFDLIDRCADPNLLFDQARRVVASGGLLLATTTLGSGFDIQVLWEAAEGIYPPERLNLLSVEGLTTLVERHGFEVLEFSTPGMFDVESVGNASAQGLPRFIRYLLEHRDDDAREALQEFLQRFRLSSFGRVALRKKA